MKNPFRYISANKNPPTDSELFSNLDASTFVYLSVINDYVNKENQILDVSEMSKEEIEVIYRLVADAALGNFSHTERESLKVKLLEKIPTEFSVLRRDISDDKYLPAPTPPKFVGWIQGLLNQTFPPDKHISDEQFGMLFVYIGSAFRQGTLKNTSEQLTEFEDNLATLLFAATHRGFEEALEIKGLRDSANRHLAQIFMLSLILGVKFSLDNDLKVSDL